MRRRTPAAVLAAATAAAFAVLLAAAAPAQATGYRYWSYWLRSGGTWTYAQTGPAMHTPADGDVEGWRFAVSRDAAATAVQPRGAADFATICAGTPAAKGSKRVALVIDPGTAADAPGGETPPAPRTACARIPAGASSADAVAAVARPLRYDSSGILCAIAGYPRSGCGETVSGGKATAGGSTGSGGGAATSGSSTTAAAPSSHHGGGPSAGLYAGIAAVAVVGGAAVWQARRRKPRP
ncbi:MAG: SCO2322 family protein [Actinomycetia bacterium]|nr:SCO2322 family protein [Actinomycetes bacterium]